MRFKCKLAFAILLIALTNAEENLLKKSEEIPIVVSKDLNEPKNVPKDVNKIEETVELINKDIEHDLSYDDYSDEDENITQSDENTVKQDTVKIAAVIPDLVVSTPIDPNKDQVKIVNPVESADILPKARIAIEKAGKYMDYDDFRGGLEMGNDGYNWDPENRVAPSEPPTYHTDNIYAITPQRLEEIRKHFFYWYFDKDSFGGRGDYQFDIHASMPQVHKNFNFQLPFFGFRFNYTRVSMNGYLEFSDPPEHYTYPLVFPVKDWPKRNDPSFIGIFFSKCRIGRIRQTDYDQRDPGVYFRMERDLMTRSDRFGVEVRERVMWDIREGVVGADTFIPKHVIFVTWKNMSFAGGIDNSLFTTNSFQVVLATDEVYTYAIFNYATINWSAHTEAGGDTTGGEGGVPAYIGFNAGNGTQAFEYKPYSQASVLRDLTGRGWANNKPGRHIFRIDEKIMLGTCNKDIDASHLPLVFAPESGNMLGGTVVNITGPCFDVNERVLCHFDTEDVVGHVINKNRAICVQPFLKAQGYIRFEISVGNDRFKWRGKYFVETPATATERIFFETNDVYKKAPAEIKLSWNKFNLTANLNANVQISLWGYRESTIRPELEYIDMIEAGIVNNGLYTIAPANFRNRDNPKNIDMQFGFLHINLTNPQDFSGLKISPVLWSKPIPLGWYFGPQWERKHGRKWPRALCDNWLRTDRFLRNFAAELPLCPCTIEHAVLDKGRYMPDFDCDKDSNPTCLHHKGAIHCVRSGQPSPQGSEQQCCYDRHGFLMLSYDQMWGSRPRRNHNVGQMPWNEANKVPTLSTWFHDIRPYYSCCFWQDEQEVGCETFRFERRPSQDCIAYQAPAVGAVFGDPHFVTFDNLHYTFNGMGEFVLARGNDGREKFEVQGRFERVDKNYHGIVQATHLTSVATRGNTTTIIEVRLRPSHAQWRYRLDVFADGRRIYFDRPSLKFQTFHGVTVYTPTYILNQSEVVIMYSSGVGVEVVENGGFMTARVYAPWSFINKTSGLLGNWSFDLQDDFTLPDSRVIGVNLNSFESVHKDFGINWMLADRAIPNVGAALFVREFGRTASYYSNFSFIPNYVREPRDFLPSNRSYDIERATDLCGESYQCRFDYGMSLNRDMAHFTKNYYDSAVNIKAINERRVISCGILETPRFGRKLNFDFTPGARVSFECNEGFVLTGDARRVCTAEGHWDTPVEGYTECLREVYYTRRTAWIAIGIILAVIAPLMLCILCGVYCYRKKAMKEDPNWKMSLPRSRAGSRSGSRTNLRHMNSDVSDTTTDQDALKKPQSFAGSYNTNEPLEGRPDIQFPAKKWDLDDDDFTSSENGSELNHSKIARDIEYIKNTGSSADKPKQSGRRSLRSQSEIIEEEDPTQQHPNQANYMPISPPTEDLLGVGPSQQQQQYSPTFSAAENERNSGGSSNDPRFGGVRVFPQTNEPYFSRTAPNTPVSPISPLLLTQESGLPHGTAAINTKSTEV